MAITYAAFNNSPCCIIREAVGLAGDGASRFLRVGAAGCALPAGWQGGTPSNPVFFEKLLAAAQQLTGVTGPQLGDPALVASVPLVFFQWQAGQPVWETALAGTFPNGSLLSLPFFESISNTFGTLPLVAGNNTSFYVGDIVFENTGGASVPTFADFETTVDDSVNNLTPVTIKIFHTLTA